MTALDALEATPIPIRLVARPFPIRFDAAQGLPLMLPAKLGPAYSPPHLDATEIPRFLVAKPLPIRFTASPELPAEFPLELGPTYSSPLTATPIPVRPLGAPHV